MFEGSGISNFYSLMNDVLHNKAKSLKENTPYDGLKSFIDNTKLAMLCITAIEVCALMLGIDGALLSTVVAVLAGLQFTRSVYSPSSLDATPSTTI